MEDSGNYFNCWAFVARDGKVPTLQGYNGDSVLRHVKWYHHTDAQPNKFLLKEQTNMSPGVRETYRAVNRPKLLASPNAPIEMAMTLFCTGGPVTEAMQRSVLAVSPPRANERDISLQFPSQKVDVSIFHGARKGHRPGNYKLMWPPGTLMGRDLPDLLLAHALAIRPAYARVGA